MNLSFNNQMLPALIGTALLLVSCGQHVESHQSIWRLNSLSRVGGQNPEILGSPQVMANSSGTSIQFNGQSDGLLLPINPIQGFPEFTIQALIKPESRGNVEQRFLHIQDEANNRALLELRMYENGWALDAFLYSAAGQRALFDQTKLHPADQWAWVAMTYRDGTLTSYVNSSKELEGAVSFLSMGPGRISLGVRQNQVSWFRGEIREVRFSPRALAADQLERVQTNLPNR